jgi:hypothetical protein
MIPATEGCLRLQMKSKSSMPWTALVCIPLLRLSAGFLRWCASCGEGNLLDETSCLGVEELVVGLRSECSAGRGEACDVVVGRGGLAVGHSSRSHCRCVWVESVWVRVFPG